MRDFIIINFISLMFKDSLKKIQRYWENNLEFLKKRKKGKTGYPIVDAGIRQLLKKGLWHNRLRMIRLHFTKIFLLTGKS